MDTAFGPADSPLRRTRSLSVKHHSGGSWNKDLGPRRGRDKRFDETNPLATFIALLGAFVHPTWAVAGVSHETPTAAVTIVAGGTSPPGAWRGSAVRRPASHQRARGCEGPPRNPIPLKQP